MGAVQVVAEAPVAATLPAVGQQEVVLEAPSFGRYAVVATSSQGTAVQVRDRMAGVLGADGAPGGVDGRVDLFLDRGQIQVVTEADPAGTGEVAVRLIAFAEASSPLRLPPEQRVETTLTDLQARSWWVDVPAGGPVAFEAAGRHLADLRLWRDGVWQVDAAPSCARFEPTVGAPWQRCTLGASLEPGVYLVSAYGGRGAPWTSDDPSAPLAVQWGVPRLATSGQLTATLPASGYTRVRLPAGPDTVHVALPEVAPFRVTGAVRAKTELTSESRRPAVAGQLAGSGDRTVTLTGAPGQRYTLTWFKAGTTAQVPAAGTYWVGALTTADPADVLPMTGLAVQEGPVPGSVVRAATQAWPLSRDTAWSGKVNLTKETSILVEVADAGRYRFAVEGVVARLQLEPFLLTPVEGVAPSEPVAGALAVELNPGLFVLRLRPEAPGIATVTLGSERPSAAVTAVRPVLQLPSVALAATARVLVQAAPDAQTGVFVRSLPIDPLDPLPIVLLPGESVAVPVRVAERGALTFRATDGSILFTETLGAGDRVVQVDNPRNTTVSGALSFLADRARPDAALLPLDAARVATLDAFPRLKEGKPVGVELTDGVPRTVRLTVDQPGLYVLASTGLLATTGALRTRTVPALAEAAENGPGRNFQLARFLTSGDYQLTATAVAPSAGHAGLALRAGGVVDGGVIRDATPARVTLAPDEAVRHALVVGEAGHYAVSHAGRSRPFTCRLEDADGWTVTEVPEQTCDFTAWLDTGTYVLLGLPERLETRRVTTVRRVDAAPVAQTGHGPFPLALNTPVAAVWVEPTGDGERPSDVWELDLPAELHATVELSPEMVGEVVVGAETVGRLGPGAGWSGVLPQGQARVVVRGGRRGTGVPYTLRVEADELVAGSRVVVASRATRTVAVGEPGVYTIESDGAADVRARLLDAEGRIVAANDDGPDDWNFRISARLDPGRYRLVLDEVAAAADDGSVGLTMRAPREVASGPLRSGARTAVRPGRDALVYDLADTGAEVVVATAEGAENVGIAIEVSTATGWRGVAVGTGRRAVAVARVADAPVRVRVWSEDGRGGEVGLTVHGLRPGGGGGWRAARVSESAGQFVIESEAAAWVCGVPGAACVPARNGVASAPAQGLLVVSEGGGVATRRLVLRDGESADLKVARAPERLDLAGGGLRAVTFRAADGTLAARFPGETRPLWTGAHAALAIGTGDAVEVWAQEGVSDVKAEVHRIETPREEAVGDGVHAFAVPPGGAVSLPLAEARDLGVNLEAGLAVATADGRGGWADAGALAVALRAARGPVLLVNLTGTERLARVEVLPAGTDAPLIAGSPHERVHTAAASWEIPVAAAEGTLRVEGSAVATYARVDGAVSRGTAFDVGPGGVLSLAVRPGPVLAWVEAPGTAGPERPGTAPPAQTVSGPAVVRLAGERAALALRPPVASAVSLRAPCPLVAQISVPGGVSRTVVADTGERIDVWVPDAAQGASVLLRALSGTALFGELVVATSAPLAIGEGLGPETLLAPDGIAWFSFEVAREGLIGFGVRATADRVDAVLTDANGVVLSRGVVGSATLASGTYFLGLSQPAGAAPVRARPVLVGLAAPPVGPPEDVVRSYLPGRR